MGIDISVNGEGEAKAVRVGEGQTCYWCNEPTNRAGETSLHFGNTGPWCDECHRVIAEIKHAVLSSKEYMHEVERLRDLAAAQEDLLVCYRQGRRPSDKLLDRIKAAKAGGDA